MSMNNDNNNNRDRDGTIAESLNDSTCTGIQLSVEEIENARQKETERAARQQAQEQVDQSQVISDRSEYWQRHFDQLEAENPNRNDDDNSENSDSGHIVIDDNGNDQKSDIDESISKNISSIDVETSEKISLNRTTANNNNGKSTKRQQRKSRRNPSEIIPGAVRVSMVGTTTALEPTSSKAQRSSVSSAASINSTEQELIDAKVRSRSLRQSAVADDATTISSGTSVSNSQVRKGRVSTRERRKATSPTSETQQLFNDDNENDDYVHSDNDNRHQSEKGSQLTNNNDSSSLDGIPVEHPRFLPSTMLHQHGAMAINGPGQDQQSNDNGDNNNGTATDVEQPQHLDDSNGIAVANVVDESELLQQAQDMLRQEMRQNTAEAEIVDEKPRKRLILGGILCCLFVVAILVGVVIRVVKNSNNQSPVGSSVLATANPTTSLIPTASPSEIPTPSPSFVPSSLPSSKPSLLPSTVPSVSPSSLPTASPTIADNESCEMAIPLDEAQGQMVQGDLYFTKALDSFASCLVFDTDDVTQDGELSGPIRWYSFGGTNTAVLLRLCTREDGLVNALFTDTCNESETLCPLVGSNEHTRILSSDTDCPKQTLFILYYALSNKIYRVGVKYGSPFEESPTLPVPLNHPFSLMQSDAAYTLELIARSDYFCEGAAPIYFEPGSRTELEFYGSTKGAPPQQEFSCEYVPNLAGTPGVWYEYYALKEYFEISACSNTPGITNQISVFTKIDLAADNACFDNLSCVAGTTNSCEEPVSFLALFNTTYYILVSSSEPDGNDYTLTIAPPVPAAEDCSGAFVLTDDEIYPGAMVEYYTDRYVVPSEVCFPDSPTDLDLYTGLWFKLEGRNSTLVISTECHRNGQGSSGLNVFRGNSTTSTCLELECVGYLESCKQRYLGNVDETFSFFTDPEYVYYIKANRNGVDFSAIYGFIIVDEYY